MKLIMKNILDKYSDCDMFSLTFSPSEYEFKITEEEYLNALDKVKEAERTGLRRIYDRYVNKLDKSYDFDKLYSEIEEECYAFNNKNTEKIKNGLINCSSIVDTIGKATKYGNNDEELFYYFYSIIGMLIDRENYKENYVCDNGKSIIEIIPEDLKNNYLFYEVSFFNLVTVSGQLMINYYFKLNDETRKYLLKFSSDFDLIGLEDLALYKDGKVMFSSCTHEKFNSLD